MGVAAVGPLLEAIRRCVSAAVGEETVLESVSEMDRVLLAAVNGWAGRYPALDYFVAFVVNSDLMKGIPVMLLWWGLWFWRRSDQQKLRSGLIAVLVCAIGAIFVGRGLAVLLPFRLRPLHDLSVDSVLPIGASERTLGGWSSMPSDHAVLFFAMAAGMLMLNRAIGYLLLVHAVFIIGLPRVFMGFHYPSDVAVGAVLGVLIVGLMWVPVVRLVERSRAIEYEARAGHFVYPVLFLVTYQAGTMFNESRRALTMMLRVARQFIG